jgi:Uma2 family endonuclease
VRDLIPIYQVVTDPESDEVLPGANISDRRSGWEKNFRCPDIVVILYGSRAVDCGTHWFGGPDFLTEIMSPGDDTDQKIPFYSQLQVRELLIIHRDTRELRLLRHNGRELVEIEPVLFKGKMGLVSEVLPLAFRRISIGGKVRTEILRSDRRRKWIA